MRNGFSYGTFAMDFAGPWQELSELLYSPVLDEKAQHGLYKSGEVFLGTEEYGLLRALNTGDSAYLHRYVSSPQFRHLYKRCLREVTTVTSRNSKIKTAYGVAVGGPDNRYLAIPIIYVSPSMGPEGPATLMRYPLISPTSGLRVNVKWEQGLPDGVIRINADVWSMLGGDFDGDLAWVAWMKIPSFHVSAAKERHVKEYLPSLDSFSPVEGKVEAIQGLVAQKVFTGLLTRLVQYMQHEAKLLDVEDQKFWFSRLPAIIQAPLSAKGCRDLPPMVGLIAGVHLNDVGLVHASLEQVLQQGGVDNPDLTLQKAIEFMGLYTRGLKSQIRGLYGLVSKDLRLDGIDGDLLPIEPFYGQPVAHGEPSHNLNEVIEDAAVEAARENDMFLAFSRVYSLGDIPLSGCRIIQDVRDIPPDWRPIIAKDGSSQSVLHRDELDENELALLVWWPMTKKGAGTRRNVLALSLGHLVGTNVLETETQVLHIGGEVKVLTSKQQPSITEWDALLCEKITERLSALGGQGLAPIMGTVRQVLGEISEDITREGEFRQELDFSWYRVAYTSPNLGAVLRSQVPSISLEHANALLEKHWDLSAVCELYALTQLPVIVANTIPLLEEMVDGNISQLIAGPQKIASKIAIFSGSSIEDADPRNKWICSAKTELIGQRLPIATALIKGGCKIAGCLDDQDLEDLGYDVDTFHERLWFDLGAKFGLGVGPGLDSDGCIITKDLACQLGSVRMRTRRADVLLIQEGQTVQPGELIGYVHMPLHDEPVTWDGIHPGEVIEVSGRRAVIATEFRCEVGSKISTPDGMKYTVSSVVDELPNGIQALFPIESIFKRGCVPTIAHFMCVDLLGYTATPARIKMLMKALVNVLSRKTLHIWGDIEFIIGASYPLIRQPQGEFGIESDDEGGVIPKSAAITRELWHRLEEQFVLSGKKGDARSLYCGVGHKKDEYYLQLATQLLSLYLSVMADNRE